MTAKYYLTKLYKNNAKIIVTSDSLESFLTGERNTLDHIVTYEHQSVLVRAKPRKPNYKNYVSFYGFTTP